MDPCVFSLDPQTKDPDPWKISISIKTYGNFPNDLCRTYMLYRKRFYNRETNSLVFWVIKLMSFKPTFPYYGTQIINHFLKLNNSANHDKGERFQQIMKSLYPLFLECKIQLYRHYFSGYVYVYCIYSDCFLFLNYLFHIRDHLLKIKKNELLAYLKLQGKM